VESPPPADAATHTTDDLSPRSTGWNAATSAGTGGTAGASLRTARSAAGQTPRPDDAPPIVHPRRDRRQRRRRRWILGTLAVVAFTVAGSLGGYLARFEWRWHRAAAAVGADLQALRAKSHLHPLHASGGAGQAAALPACRPVTLPNGVTGVLEIPSLGLRAPIEQGDSDAVMAVAVGHEPQSVPAGTPGTAVYVAHDVSYFVHIDELRPGETIEIATGCRVLRFSVESGRVVRAGSPVVNSVVPSIALVTCWPTNALWFTDQRYVVLARLTSTEGARSPATTPRPTGPPLPPVDLPAGLLKSDLTLQTNWWPMGTLSLSGNAPPSLAEGPVPLQAEAEALEVLFGLRHALASGNTAWWHGLAPGIAPTSWLGGGPAAPLDVEESYGADGQLTGVVLSSRVTGYGAFRLVVTPVDGHLLAVGLGR